MNLWTSFSRFISTIFVKKTEKITGINPVTVQKPLYHQSLSNPKKKMLQFHFNVNFQFYLLNGLLLTTKRPAPMQDVVDHVLIFFQKAISLPVQLDLLGSV